MDCVSAYYSLHINCGGGEVKDNDNRTIYEKDNDFGGASYFGQSGKNQGFSSTGHYWDLGEINLYVKKSTSSISGKNPQLYMDAREFPNSLSYYGFCLGNGNYTISLRRIFDVYIQGLRVLKDFNIEDEAGGANIGIVKNFSVAVTDTTLDIRFYWAARGIVLPDYGVYGPLISAISVNPGKL
ncbi:unnamed protein product [Fraxinus pennsylvanica]|uniref:Malectin domain-containing protein n=1 Tax=Fraxinus pennsylvanica TaxID=56036 RepID=A0AAD2ECC7_9LAMI|nr:unnamed protein product [Fraxinus pennsylvanica]